MQPSSYQVITFTLLLIACVAQVSVTKVTSKPKANINPSITIHLGNSTYPTTFKLWPNAVVPYDKAWWLTVTYEWKNITKAMKQFEDNTCVRFTERTNESDYIYIDNVNIYNRDSTYCSGDIGQVGGKQVVTLGWSCPTVGLSVHELMHILGFFHEHQRPNRDEFVNIYWNNITSKVDYAIYYDAKYLEKLKVPYDIKSIMHYNGWDRNQKLSVVAKTIPHGVTVGTELSNTEGLTAQDIKKINRLYKCPAVKKEKPSKTKKPKSKRNSKHRRREMRLPTVDVRREEVEQKAETIAQRLTQVCNSETV